MTTTALAFFLLAGASAPDPGADERALLALHLEVMRAHLESNAEILMGSEAEDYVVAGRGEITRPTKEERRAHFARYLGRTRFSEYRDLVPPIPRVSGDGTLGWVVVQVYAKGIQRQDDGKEQTLEFTSAWIELYEKRGGRWLRTGNVSNFKPQGPGN